jgi:TolB protein
MVVRNVLVTCAVVMLASCSNGATSSDASASHQLTTSARPTSQPTSANPIDIRSLTGRITFSDDTNDIWSIWADGTHLRRLTSAPAMEFDPTWSPHGRRIAYRHQGGDDGKTEIYVMNADGSHERALTHNDVADWGPDWSSDGRRILWNSAVGTGGFGFYGYDISPDGTGRRLITRHYVEYPAWSPDGTRIAFMAQEPGASGSNPDYNIFVMNADGTHIARLTATEAEDGWPAWSPDGRQIVFSSARDDCSISGAPDCRTTGDIGPWADVWIMNADGSNLRRVTAEFGQFFAWSPDGSAILVTGNQPFLIRPDGTGLTAFPAKGVAHPLFPDWIPA